jgi:hypothetical protein
MKREDFYTGEPVPNGSPNLSQNEAFCSPSEAVQNATFGQYDYDPSARMNSYATPGMVGYNPNQMYMNPPQYQQGIGMGGYYPNPYFNSQYQYYNPYYQQQMYQQQQYYQQQQQMYYWQQQQAAQQVYIQPLSFSGQYLPTAGWEEKLDSLFMDYWSKQQEADAKQVVDRQNSGYYNGYNGMNYYGIPYYNPYQYSNLYNEVNQQINGMIEEAKQNRIALNLRLAKLAHNIQGDNYDEKELEERYTGKTISVETVMPNFQEAYLSNRLANMVPFDNSQMYRDQAAAISREFNSIVPQDSNMEECFEKLGILHTHYLLQDEQARRRDGSVLYNSQDNSYKYFVRAKAAERYASKNGSPIISSNGNPVYTGGNNGLNQTLLSSFPTLSQSAHLCDDGTLKITCPFGSHAGQTYIANSQEAGYEQDRQRFNSFLNSIPEGIYNTPKGGETK